MPKAFSRAGKEKAISIIIISVLIIFIVFQFIMRPSIRTLKDLNQKVLRVKEGLKNSESLLARKSKIEGEFLSAQARLEELKLTLPLRSEMPNVLQEISRLASESKIKILKLEPLKMEKSPQITAGPQTGQAATQTAPTIYIEVPIKLEARGSYHSIGEFINKVEDAKNIMSIRDLEIKSNSSDIMNHDARLLIVAYVFKEE